MVRHRRTRTPEYRTWLNMMARCYKPNHPRYRYYGGRGICVAEAFRTFDGFFAYLGPRPEGCSLDRIDPRRNYEPGNVRWVLMKDQAVNKRDTVFYTFEGESLSRSEWARKKGMSAHTLWWRLKRWPPEKALGTPVRPWQRRAAG